MYKTYKSLQERLRGLREEAGLSQGQVAERLTEMGEPTSRQTVGMWETAGTVPETLTTVRLAELYGVRVRWLVLGEEPQEEVAPVEMGKRIALARAALEGRLGVTSDASDSPPGGPPPQTGGREGTGTNPA